MKPENIKSEDRVLFVINDNEIKGSTRFQKYGFLLWEQYQKELKKIASVHESLVFYDDWKPHYYGPFSTELQNDIDACIKNGLLCKSKGDGLKLDIYWLTLKGRIRWRKFFTDDEYYEEAKKINDKIRNLQKVHYYSLLRQIYKEYPKYAANSKIRDLLLNRP